MPLARSDKTSLVINANCRDDGVGRILERACYAAEVEVTAVILVGRQLAEVGPTRVGVDVYLRRCLPEKDTAALSGFCVAAAADAPAAG